MVLIKPSNQHQSTTVKSKDATYENSQTPTLFLHGYGGSANSEKFMVKQAKQKGVTKEVVTALVSNDGEVKLKGKLKKDAINPIVQIELDICAFSIQSATAIIIKEAETCIYVPAS
nr:alpha/beta hydrolase [Mammaliicoccus lentus]